jgi:hypothetical protein
MLAIVDEKPIAVFIAGVAQPLYGLLGEQRSLIPKAAVPHAVWLDMLGKITACARTHHDRVIDLGLGHGIRVASNLV